MFHRFCAGPNGVGIRSDELHAFICRVRQDCDFVTMRDLAQRLRDGERSSRPLAVITVDDGYSDFHAVALPVLRRLGVAATVYATAGFIDRRCWLWWDALRYLIDAHPKGERRLQIGNEAVLMQLDDARSRHRAWSKVADKLVSRNEARAEVIAEIEQMAGVSLPAVPTAGYAAMTWEQLGELEACGVEVGGHTMTHAFLPGLDQDALQAEIAGQQGANRTPPELPPSDLRLSERYAVRPYAGG